MTVKFSLIKLDQAGSVSRFIGEGIREEVEGSLNRQTSGTTVELSTDDDRLLKQIMIAAVGKSKAKAAVEASVSNGKASEYLQIAHLANFTWNKYGNFIPALREYMFDYQPSEHGIVLTYQEIEKVADMASRLNGLAKDDWNRPCSETIIEALKSHHYRKSKFHQRKGISRNVIPFVSKTFKASEPKYFKEQAAIVKNEGLILGDFAVTVGGLMLCAADRGEYLGSGESRAIIKDKHNWYSPIYYHGLSISAWMPRLRTPYHSYASGSLPP